MFKAEIIIAILTITQVFKYYGLPRQFCPVFAMALGCVWASFIWYIVADVYYNNIISLGTEHLQFCMMILSIINLVLLPIALILNKVVELLFKVTYLDELLFISA